MKYLLTLALLGSTLALTACGGDSDSSGSQNTNTSTNTDNSASGTCLAGTDCGSDVDDNACPILGGIVNVTAKGCTYASPNIQSSSNLWTCVDGKVNTPGSVNITTTKYTDDKYTVQCAK